MAEQWLSLNEKVEIIRLTGENNRSTRAVAREFNVRHPLRQISYSVVAKINRLFNQSGSVIKTKRKRNNRQNVDQVILDAFNDNPRSSIRDMALNLNLTRNKIWRCLRRYKLKPFKPKFLHTLEEGDDNRRLEYCFWAQGNYLNDRHFLEKIMFSDEATFTTNGVVSSQNCRYWTTENPHWVINCKRQYSEKVNVWCGILGERIIGPFFFLQTLNAIRLLHFLNNELMEVIDDFPLAVLRDMFFQLDGASIHNSIIVRRWLNVNFPQKWIGRNSPLIEWPPRSPDITPLDFYFWGTIKNKVYKTRPRSRQELCDRITQACQEINIQELRRVARNNKKRIEKCITIDGGLVEKGYI